MTSASTSPSVYDFTEAARHAALRVVGARTRKLAAIAKRRDGVPVAEFCEALAGWLAGVRQALLRTADAFSARARLRDDERQAVLEMFGDAFEKFEREFIASIAGDGNQRTGSGDAAS